ncbi:MAG: hypothetical protein PHZ26_02095 [Candidatus Gracilibacteria bacterium]|nr:hypothetical protein [Candidatus Gracilibacteria bacterium]MDD2908526.1 hypothetical protein [Candidatus Gracilibacteria bacterium]
MKKIITVTLLSLTLLVSCGENKIETENISEKTEKIELQPNKVEESIKIEESTGSYNIEASTGSTVSASGELSDSGSDEALDEIDKLIEEISKEK